MQQELARGYRTDFNSHRGMIAMMARKGWGRLQEAGVVIDYDDVFQEMSLIYCKAVEKYDPEKGITFTAYLGRAIWNSFNQIAKRLINDQCGLGLVRFEDMDSRNDNDETGSFVMNGIASCEPSPEERCVNSRSFRDAMKTLPAMEKLIVGRVMKQVVRRDGEKSRDMSIAEIMHELNLNRKQIMQARSLIGNAFGVSLKGTR